MKTGQKRIDDAVDYIYSIGKAELANHVATLVQTSQPSRIGRELSLGSRDDDEDDPQYAANTATRQALRALLLCQRVYFSDLWSELVMVGGARHRHNHLTPQWKQTSLAYWGRRTEQEIVQGILTFAVTTSNAAALADAATGAPNGNHPDFTLTRTRDPFPGVPSCYGAVMAWMFKSGLASYRWYLKNSGANNEASLRQAFGPARQIWGATQLFSAMHRLPAVPRGHIVHLYVYNPARWNGHWLVSLGDGTARACNNDDTDGTNRIYTPGCSLNNQFLNGYKDAMPGGTAIPFERGIAEVIDPTEMPGRL